MWAGGKRTYACSLSFALAACGRSGFDVRPDADLASCTLQLAPDVARLNINSSRTFRGFDGMPPYAYEVVGTGDIDRATGELFSGAVPGSATVRVTDAVGCTAERTVAIGGDRMFYVGGTSNAVPSRTVWSSTDGITWVQVGQLPATRYDGGLLVYHDRLWWLAGRDLNATAVTDVFVSDDGVTWTLAGQVPTATYLFGYTVFDDRMWIAGGYNNANNVVWSVDGAIWTRAGGLPQDNHGGSLAAIGGKMLYAGGHNGSLFDWVLETTDGAAWTQVGTLPQGREYHAAICTSGEMFLIGGQDTTPTAFSLVTSTSDGASFTNRAPLPAARAFGALAQFRGELWSIGGSDTGAPFRAVPGGAWTSVSSTFPLPRQAGGLAAFTPGLGITARN